MRREGRKVKLGLFKCVCVVIEWPPGREGLGLRTGSERGQRYFILKLCRVDDES
jgi:hypothetical protein